MKPQHTLTGLLIILALTFTLPSESKAHRGPHHHPVWVGVHSFDVATRYVYFPDYNIYYDMHRGRYIYPAGPRWVYTNVLPQRFLHINFALAPIIELDIRTSRPYIYNRHHISWYRTYYHHDHHYARYYRGHGHGKHYDRHFHGYHSAPKHYAGPKHDKHYRKGNAKHREFSGNQGRVNQSKGNYENHGEHRQYKNDKGSYVKRESNQRSSRSGNGRGGN